MEVTAWIYMEVDIISIFIINNIIIIIIIIIIVTIIVIIIVKNKIITKASTGIYKSYLLLSFALWPPIAFPKQINPVT